MDFYNNKNNSILKFKINSEGVDVKNIEPRLIFESGKNKNYIFYGKIVENVCHFQVPELQLYEKGDQGSLKFEIISEDLYFKVWQDEFKIKTQVNITLEKMVDEIRQEDVKPKISLEMVREENAPVIEVPKITKKTTPQVEMVTEAEIPWWDQVEAERIAQQNLLQEEPILPTPKPKPESHKIKRFKA